MIGQPTWIFLLTFLHTIWIVRKLSLAFPTIVAYKKLCFTLYIFLVIAWISTKYIWGKDQKCTSLNISGNVPIAIIRNSTLEERKGSERPNIAVDMKVDNYTTEDDKYPYKSVLMHTEPYLINVMIVINFNLRYISCKHTIIYDVYTLHIYILQTNKSYRNCNPYIFIWVLS